MKIFCPWSRRFTIESQDESAVVAHLGFFQQYRRKFRQIHFPLNYFTDSSQNWIDASVEMVMCVVTESCEFDFGDKSELKAV